MALKNRETQNIHIEAKNLYGNHIREARQKRRLSQSDLATKVQTEGITLERDSISRIEIETCFVTDYKLKVFFQNFKGRY